MPETIVYKMFLYGSGLTNIHFSTVNKCCRVILLFLALYFFPETNNEGNWVELSGSEYRENTDLVTDCSSREEEW